MLLPMLLQLTGWPAASVGTCPDWNTTSSEENTTRVPGAWCGATLHCATRNSSRSAAVTVPHTRLLPHHSLLLYLLLLLCMQLLCLRRTKEERHKRCAVLSRGKVVWAQQLMLLASWGVIKLVCVLSGRGGRPGRWQSELREKENAICGDLKLVVSVGSRGRVLRPRYPSDDPNNSNTEP